jgi:hypothetical protein
MFGPSNRIFHSQTLCNRGKIYYVMLTLKIIMLKLCLSPKLSSVEHRSKARGSTIYASEIVNNELKRKHGERTVVAKFVVGSQHLPEVTVENHAKPVSASLEYQSEALTSETPWSAELRVDGGERSRKPRLTAVGIRYADHATPSIRKGWH